MTSRLFAATVIAALIASAAFGQIQPVDPEKAKKKKELDERVVQMIDQSIADASGLRLAQNRATILAMAGELYWKFDQKRSRELFRGSAGEILNHQAELEKERSESRDINGPVEAYEMDIRQEIILLIAVRDAELALELLLQTRSATLSDAMAKQAARPAAGMGEMVAYDSDTTRASQEIALEQRIAFQAADQNPDAAIKLLKDTLTKGVSWNVLPLLQKINRTDEKKAAELSSDVLRHLADANLGNNADQFRSALNFLQHATRPAPQAATKQKELVLPEAGVREVANRMAAVLLQPAKSMAAGLNLTTAMPTLEKLVPDKAPLLKQRAAENSKTLPAEFKSQQRRQAMFNPASTPEDILSQVVKMDSESEKRSAYSFLSQRIAQIPDEARARRLIDQIPDGQYRAAAMEQFDAQRMMRTAAEGKVDEARRMIAAMTNRKVQVQRLVGLAMQVNRKNTPEDRETALALMTEAKALTSEYPQDEDEISNLMIVISGFAGMEPDAAFRLFEGVIEPFNEIVQASAVLSKYNKRDRAFKKGEMVMRVNSNPGSLMPFRYVPQMQTLGKSDLEKMSMLIDRFGRGDSRTLIRLYVVQGFLR